MFFKNLFVVYWGLAKLVRQRILNPSCNGSSPLSPANGVCSVVEAPIPVKDVV
jgi:hypothetical protein